MFFSNLTAGCAQTATAQICSAMETPSSLELTYPDADKNLITLNWTRLKKHVQSHPSTTAQVYLTHFDNNNCELTGIEHATLSYFCREIGHRNNCTIINDNINFIQQTGVTMENCRQTIVELFPNTTITGITSLNDPYTELFKAMDKIKPAISIIGGENNVESDKYATHIWICDGYDMDFEERKEKGVDGVDVISTVMTRALYHFNWGECGDNNGYFSLRVFAIEDYPKWTNYKKNIRFFSIKKYLST